MYLPDWWSRPSNVTTTSPRSNVTDLGWRGLSYRARYHSFDKRVLLKASLSVVIFERNFLLVDMTARRQ